MAGGTDFCCKKEFTSQKYLVSGIFEATCLHCVCHGFSILRRAESSVTLTKFFIKHWKKAPDWIFYDDACHALSSALLREPAFFMQTRFCIDHFHSRDHNACSSAFDPATYQQMHATNTSAAEQVHSSLQRIREQAGYMRLQVFMEYVRHFLFIRNQQTGNIVVRQNYLK